MWVSSDKTNLNCNGFTLDDKCPTTEMPADWPAYRWHRKWKADRWTMKHPDGTGTGKVLLDLAKRPPRMDLIGDKGTTLFCTYRLDKGQLRLCWWPNEKERQSTLDPEKQEPPGVLMVMERPKGAGPVLDARR
jgi:uncharacterized protein (TIGR03067 family)